MAGRLDSYVTGPIPVPGNMFVNLHCRTRYEGQKTGYGTRHWGYINADVLTSTSRLLRMKQFKNPSEDVYIVWKEFEILEAYLMWLQDRILHRIDIVAKEKSTGGHPREGVLPFFRYPLSEYSPCFRDIWTLVNMWLLGFYLEDATFMDTVMSTLEQLLKEPHSDRYDDGKPARETFFCFLKREVVENIWKYTASGAKLRTFIIDQIVLYSSHEWIVRFNYADLKNSIDVGSAPETTRAQSNVSVPVRQTRRQTLSAASADDKDDIVEVYRYPEAFRKELNAVMAGSIWFWQLPEEVRHFYAGQTRVWLPARPWTSEFKGTLPEGGVYEEYWSMLEMTGQEKDAFLRVVFGKGTVYLRPEYTDDMDSTSMSMASKERRDAAARPNQQFVRISCMYHEHKHADSCWLLQAPGA